MRPKRTAFALLFLLAVLITGRSVSADIGPAPNVTVDLVNMPDGPYYVTLLSPEEAEPPFAYGPYAQDDEEQARYDRITAFAEARGLRFWDRLIPHEGDETYSWGHYPPERFHVVAWYPEHDVFLMSELTEGYAFKSHYTINAAGADVAGGDSEVIDVPIDPSYDWSRLLPGVLARIAITLVIELLIAWLLRYRSGRQIRIILVTNLITQLLLNAALAGLSFYYGTWALYAGYAGLAVLIFLIKAVVYSRRLLPNRQRTAERTGPVAYAFIANLFSFVLGFAASLALEVYLS